MNDTTTRLSETLRVVAALIEEHPDLPEPYVTSSSDGGAYLAWYLHINGRAEDEADQKAKAQQIIRTLGGKWEKDFSGDQADFRQERDGLRFTVSVDRPAVCVRRVVGTETVTLPAVEAAPERTVEREIVEWDCEPVLAEVSA